MKEVLFKSSFIKSLGWRLGKAVSIFAGVLEMSQRAKHGAHLASQLKRKALQGRQDWGVGARGGAGTHTGRYWATGEKGLLLLGPSPFYLAIRILGFLHQ